MTNHSIATILFAVVVVALTALPAGAQEKEADRDERIAELIERMEEARERLQLSDEQAEPLLSVLRESFEAKMAVLAEHGIDLQNMGEGDSKRQLNLRQLRVLRKDMDDVHEALYEKVEEQGFLSDEQFAEFKKIQEEQREALREKLRARNGGR